ncbi:TOBE domain-containing protein [Paeniroseomonas aquatica]
MGGHNVIGLPGGLVAVRTDRTRLLPVAEGAVAATIRGIEYTGTGFAVALAGPRGEEWQALLSEAALRAQPWEAGQDAGLGWDEVDVRHLAAAA